MKFSDKAKQVLEENWRGGYTIPSSTLYPFQWNWDAGFHALGWMYFKPENAMEEVRSIFKGQWKNGMLPHIVFHKENENYYPGPAEWRTHVAKNRVAGIETSGITQLPVFGFFLDRLDQIAAEKGLNIKAFIEELFPKVLQFHKYLYTHRDPLNEGLPFVLHNWESTDNAPIWDDVWERMDVTEARDISLLRKDVKNVDASMRPTNEHYKRYIYLIDLLVKNQYEANALDHHYPFRVQENLFISLLIRSNEGLLQLGKKYDIDCGELVHWQKKSKENFIHKFWDNEKEMFYPFDLNTNQLIKKEIVGGLVSLFAGVPSKEQAEKLVQKIEKEFTFNENWFLCASYSPKAADFDAKKYWRGPLWPNVNWLLYHGLKRYGYDKLAQKIKDQTVYLIEQIGFFEYFDPRPESENPLETKGLGGHNFSWTAAIYLDFTYNNAIL